MKLRTITLATICTILTITLVTHAGTFTAKAGDLVLFHTRQLIYKPYALNYTFAGAIRGGLLPKQVLDYWSRPETFPAHGLTYIYYGAFLTSPYKYGLQEIWATYLENPHIEAMWLLRQEWWHNGLPDEFMSGTIGEIYGGIDIRYYNIYFSNGTFYYPIIVSTAPATDYLYGSYAFITITPNFYDNPQVFHFAFDYGCNNIWVTLPNGQPLEYGVYCNASRNIIDLIVKLPKYVKNGAVYLYIWINLTGSGNPYISYRNDSLFSVLSTASISDIHVKLYYFPELHLGELPHYLFQGDTYVYVKSWYISNYLDPVIITAWYQKIDYSYNNTPVGAIVIFNITAKVDDPVITVWADDRFALLIPSLNYVCNHWYGEGDMFFSACKLPLKAGETVKAELYFADVGGSGILMILPYHFPIGTALTWRWLPYWKLILKDNKTYFYIISTEYNFIPSEFYVKPYEYIVSRYYRNDTLLGEGYAGYFPPPHLYTISKVGIYMLPIGYIGGYSDNHVDIYLGKVVQLFAVTDQVVLPSNYSHVLDTLSSRDIFFLFDPSYFNGSYVFAFLGDGVGLVTYPMKIDYNVKEGTYKLPNGKVVTYGWWVTPTDHPFAYVVSGVEP